MIRAPSFVAVIGVVCAFGCSHLHDAAVHRAPSPPSVVANPGAHSSPESRVTDRQLNGQSFPDGVIALTWDDGPDLHTLELARYLRRERVSATFFVVGRWDSHVSDDPGVGKEVFSSGYERIPVLGDIVRLGHRLGNHTLNHALLTHLAPEVAVRQLVENQRRLDPFVTNELPLFRAPGGDWDASIARAVISDPELGNLVGPVRWDIDEKDWQGSIECRSPEVESDCETAPSSSSRRLKPSATARRYLQSIERARRGIVLLHDRVADVGSRYALEVAKALVPALEAKGYVFVSPVLRFSSPRARALDHSRLSAAALGFPRARPPGGVRSNLPSWRADVDGDARLDACTETEEGIFCSLARDEPSTAARRWSAGSDFSASDSRGWLTKPAYYETLRFADINGDGRADVCGRASEGVVCALSTGHEFTDATVWLREAMTDADGWLGRDPASFRLADVNGDDRADVCAIEDGKARCGLAP